ncbi:MAG: hypothetical protein HXS52_07555 [Theionarchaea archaeon]|nr:hypothetical protein [Theionarchaea archaeon]MBU7037773.1 hypothetical protein [Theionarchaea archaeon]
MKMKMSIDEFLDFFDLGGTQMRGKIQRVFPEGVPKPELDTICAADSLFRRSVIDFGGLSSHSGGGKYAKHGFAVN